MEDIHICLECIGDKPLRAIVAEAATQVKKCKYCKREGLGIPMENLAKIVDPYLRNHCCKGEYDYSGEQDGESLDWILQEELDIVYEPAVDLVDILLANDPSRVWHDGDIPFYDEGENYVIKQGSSGEYHQSWKEFTAQIKHQGRFFDRYAREQLAAILGEPGSPKAKELPCMEIGPDTRVETLYRARLADSEKKIEAILKAPSVELGLTPVEKAMPGRMNPAGISVFYGALSEETAIAEIRPSVGNFAVVGGFKPARKLRLLNLPQIKIGFVGSIFHPDYEDRLARFSFFKIFHTLIARPIQPCDELLEYIPTQAVAEYVASVLGFDGILYASAQAGEINDEDPEAGTGMRIAELTDAQLGCYNVVLFGGAALSKQKTDHPVIPGLEPALFYQDKSAKMMRINSVKYGYEHLLFVPHHGVAKPKLDE